MNNLRLLAMSLTLLGSIVVARSAEPKVFTLQEIFRSAETNSAQMLPYYAAQEVAERGIKEAKTARLPEITANLSVGYNGNGFTTRRDYSDYQIAHIPHLNTGLGVTVEQPVYTGGAITHSIEMAEIKASAARFASDLQTANIRFRLTGYYLDIYKYHNLRRVMESNLTLAEKVLEEMKVRHGAGTALRNDITRYELLTEQYGLQLTKIDNMLSILNTELVSTAGLPKETIVMPDTTILDAALPMQECDWWKNEANTNSPELKLMDSQLQINRKAEELVKSERMPKIGLKAGWTMDGPILVEVPPINRNLSYWYVGVGVNYNISSLYKNDPAMRRSKAATLEAQQRLDATRENIETGINSDYIRYLEAYEELKTQQKSVELAESNYQVTHTRFSNDMALITDMLDAANSLLNAQQQLVNARIDIIYYYYKLLFTTGKI